MSLVRRCDDKRRLTDLYTSVRGAALLKASQRVVFKFRVNYRSHLPNSDNASRCQVPLFCNENLSDNRQVFLRPLHQAWPVNTAVMGRLVSINCYS